MRCLLLVILVFYCLSQNVMAENKDDVEKMLKCRLDSVISVLEKNDLSTHEKNKKVVEIVSPMFDFPQMAKLTLGKRHWPGLSKDEKKRFTELFVNRIKTSYCDKLTLYTNEKVIYKETIQTKRRLRISTYLMSKDNNISILYKFFEKQGEWKIYDLEIQGVSVIQTYRMQFNQILQSGSIDDLLLKLEEPVNS